jgi:hypothetical protein
MVGLSKLQKTSTERRKNMRYLVLSVLAAFILTVAVPLHAHQEIQGGEAACIEVVSESGSTFLSIPHKDFSKGATRIIKKYLEARKGESYGIVVRNMTSGRIGVVIAVDGRNIISGKKSYLRNSEEMYIVNGYEHATFEGWRTDSDTVHRFYFTDTADSYSVRTFEDSSAMGVIAVAVYREKDRPQPLYQSKRPQHPSPAASAGSQEASKAAPARDESAGTGFGSEQYSPAIKVAFEPASIPVQKTLVKYEWREVLCKKGLLQCRQEPRNRLWDGDDYAPYPPGYRGR